MTFNCSEQIGGFNNIEIYTLEECSNWPTVLTDHNADEVNFSPIPASIDGRLINESIQVNERPRKSASGSYYEVSISFEFASQSPALEQLLDQYKAAKVVAIACKHFPQKKLYGSNNAPLELDYQLNNGRRPEDGSITRVTITGKSPRRAVNVLSESEL